MAAPCSGDADRWSWLYAGNTEYPAVLVRVTGTTYLVGMNSENPSGAVNQQERPGFEQWIVGFVDGEGCFSISVVRNRSTSLGWQVQHEFVVAQSAPSKNVLEELQEFFGCGFVYENERHDNHRWPLARYVVRRRQDLRERIVPFFEDNPLITAKRNDFMLFCSVLDLMDARRHLDTEGLAIIAAITEKMNRKQRSRYLESSEAIRQPSPADARR